MGRYKGKNLHKIYKQSNKSIINHRAYISEREMKGCLSKVGYDTEFEADVEAAKQKFKSYKCIYCPHWHLTSGRKHNANDN